MSKNNFKFISSSVYLNPHVSFWAKLQPGNDTHSFSVEKNNWDNDSERNNTNIPV